MLQQGLFTDVGVRVMDKSARLNVTIGIDMQIVAATSNTAVYKFRIILKVNCENRLCATVFADAVIHLFTLVRRREQLHSGIRCPQAYSGRTMRTSHRTPPDDRRTHPS